MLVNTPWEKAGMVYDVFCLHSMWNQESKKKEEIRESFSTINPILCILLPKEGRKKTRLLRVNVPYAPTPPPLIPLRGQKTFSFFSPFVINFSIEPVLRLGLTLQKKLFE